MPHSAPSPNPSRSWLIALFALGFLAVNGAISLIFLPFPSALDELAHLSYIRWIETHPAPFVRYETMRTLAPDLRSWAGPIWTSHPTAYYLLMAPIDAAFRSIIALRIANLALALVGVSLMLIAGFVALGHDSERAVYAALIVLFPKIGIVAGLINNDNLALLAAGLGFLGLVKLRDRSGGWLIAAGLALAGWTKLTAYLMLGFGCLFAELLVGEDAWRRWLHASAGAVIGATPTLVNVLWYGSPLWRSPNHPVSTGAKLAALPFLERAFRQLADTWSALEPSSPIAVLGLVLVLLIAAYTCVRGWRRWPAAVGMILALVPVLLLQLWFLWDEGVHHGFLDQFASRYYYGVWPGFALGAALLWGTCKGPARLVIAAVTGVCLLMSSAAFCIALTLGAGKLPS